MKKPNLYELRAQVNAAYHERNLMVAALSKLYPAHLAIDIEQPKHFQHVVCIHSPAGQISWHFPANELHFFKHLEIKPTDWDGHSTKEKYKRLAKL